METGAEPPPTALVQAGEAGAFAGGAGRSAGDHHEAPRSTSERGSRRRWADGSAKIVCAVIVPLKTLKIMATTRGLSRFLPC